jgi:uncharacterized integral membrane protein
MKGNIMTEVSATKESAVDEEISEARGKAVEMAQVVAVISMCIFVLMSMSVVSFNNSQTTTPAIVLIVSAAAFSVLLFFYVGVFVRSNLRHRELLAEKYSKN